MMVIYIKKEIIKEATLLFNAKGMSFSMDEIASDLKTKAMLDVIPHQRITDINPLVMREINSFFESIYN